MKPILKGIFALTLGVAAVAARPANALQDAPQSAKAATRFIGAITSIKGDSLTVKSDAGVEATITVDDSTRILQTLPGQKDLSGATPIHMTDLQVGDRVLARASLSDDGKTYAASTLIAIKQADLAQKHQQEREEWQRSGEGGLVKSVDPAAKTVTVSVMSGGVVHPVVIQTTPATILRRYAPDSIAFDDARPASFDAIKPGDQLRARGTKSADGSQLQTDEIVSGTFRNLVATVISVDPATGTLTARDLVAKVPVVIHITSSSQLKKLPPMMAQMLAMRLKNPNGAAGAGAPGSDVGGAGQWHGGQGTGAGSGAPADRPRGDLQSALSRAPSIQLSDLQKGDAIMVVTTEGSPTVPATAVSLLAGVEPMLQASASGSQSMLSSSWNLNSSGPEMPQ
jgi:hypothetical protein